MKESVMIEKNWLNIVGKGMMMTSHTKATHCASSVMSASLTMMTLLSICASSTISVTFVRLMVSPMNFLSKYVQHYTKPRHKSSNVSEPV